MPDNNTFDKSVTVIVDPEDYHNWRLTIAINAASGLLASQPKEGWNLGHLAVTSLRTADALLEIASNPLPQMTTAPTQSVEDVGEVDLEILDTPKS